MNSKRRKRQKNKYWYEFILSTVFTILILGISIMNFSKSDDNISVIENRNLKQMPDFSLESVFDGDFTHDYESYVSDQFIDRDSWIKFKAKIDILCGKKKINDVYIGKNNYLFEQFKESEEDETINKIQAINEFREKNSNININFMLVPTAGKIYEENLPDYAPQDDQNKYIDKIKAGLDENINFIDVYDDLKNNKDDYIYYKTDHHWTTDGAYIAYESMCRQLNMEAVKKEDFHIKTVSDDFKGSLYYKLGAGIGVDDSINIYIPKEYSNIVADFLDEQYKSASLYSNSKLDTKDKYEVFMNGNHKQVKIKTSGNYDKKLLVIKDSYANCFIPFLTNHYGQIDVVDLRYYTDNINEIIQSEDITDVLFLYNVNTFNDDSSILNIADN